MDSEFLVSIDELAEKIHSITTMSKRKCNMKLHGEAGQACTDLINVLKIIDSKLRLTIGNIDTITGVVLPMLDEALAAHPLDRQPPQRVGGPLVPGEPSGAAGSAYLKPLKPYAVMPIPVARAAGRADAGVAVRADAGVADRADARVAVRADAGGSIDINSFVKRFHIKSNGGSVHPDSYHTAIEEMTKNPEKVDHYMWYVFPVLLNELYNPTVKNRFYAFPTVDYVKAYVADPILYGYISLNIKTLYERVKKTPSFNIKTFFGADINKLIGSLTLFSHYGENTNTKTRAANLLQKILKDNHYLCPDEYTMRLIQADGKK